MTVDEGGSEFRSFLPEALTFGRIRSHFRVRQTQGEPSLADRTSMKSVREASALAGDLMLAPAVAMIRLELLAAEAQSLNPWRVETVRAVTEKVAAFTEGAVAAQLSYAQSLSRFWVELGTGRMPSVLSGDAVARSVHAALKPSGRRVKANYARLGSTKSKG